MALKVIRGGTHVDEHAVKLFQREVQALARMKHPGIAAIYEAGRTADGEHFFAMELVRGVRATEYLVSRRASAGLETRLRLFIKICEAVNYAHQRGEGRVVRRLATAGAVFALPLMVFTGSRKALNTVRVNAPVETRRGVLYVAPEAADGTRQIIGAIQNAVPAGGETFFFPYHAQMYFLTATRNPTRYDVLLAEFHSPQQIEEAIGTLRAREPPYIFSFDAMARWSIRPHFPGDPPDILGPHPVEKMLREPGSGYQKVATVADVEVWARKP